MTADRRTWFAVPVAAALLLWPALWNGYPIVFADTGTYLSQAIHRYAGWDRPVFYSMFMFPLHATVTLWPVAIAQALLTAWVLWRTCQALVPEVPAVAFIGGVGLLAVGTWLPFLVSEAMPDLFTPLLVLLMCLLALGPPRQPVVLAGLAAFMIATQLSSLPLACGLAMVLGFMPSTVNISRRGTSGPAAGHPPALRSDLAHWHRNRAPRKKNMAYSSPIFSHVRFGIRDQGEKIWHAECRFATLCHDTGGKPAVGMPDYSPPDYSPLDYSPLAHYPDAYVAGSGPAMTRGQSLVPHVPDAHGANSCQNPGEKPFRRWMLLLVSPVLAVTGLCVVNLAAHGRFAVSPFGNIFMLARVIYDGPGMTALRRDCPVSHWRLCPFLDAFPPTSDDFLWTPDSPLNRAGGPKIVSLDADAIIRSALRTDPFGEARAALGNTLRQLVRFQSGDGLTAWPDQVSPVIARDFPARELVAYAAARQQAGSLSVPPLLAWIHRIVAFSGVAGCVLLLPAAIRRRGACAALLLAVLIALPLSAAITGGLSAPHDRYQARIMWLPPFVAVLSFAALRRRPA